MSKKKKIIILSCMVALLAVTAVFNFVLSAPNQVIGEQTVEVANYFSQYRTERSQSRNEQILQLNQVIESAEDNSETKNQALSMKLKLTKIIEDELLLEKLIKAKGYEDIVVSIGLTSENVNVIVRDQDFDQDDAVVIYSILSSEVNATPDKVNIIPIN